MIHFCISEISKTIWTSSKFSVTTPLYSVSECCIKMKTHRAGSLLLIPLGTCLKKDTEKLCRQEVHKAVLTYKAYFGFFFLKAMVSNLAMATIFLYFLFTYSNVMIYVERSFMLEIIWHIIIGTNWKYSWYLTLGAHMYYSITMTHSSHGATVCLVFLALDGNRRKLSQNINKTGVPEHNYSTEKGLQRLMWKLERTT